MRDLFFAEIKEEIRSQFDLSEPINFTPKKLKRAGKIIRSKYEEGDLSSPLDLERVKRKAWLILNNKKRKLDELTEEESKYIAQIAYTGDNKKLIEVDEFWTYAKNQLESSIRTSILSQWLHVYLRHETSKLKHSDDLGKLLKQIFENYDSKSSRVNTWKENLKLLFNTNADYSTGKKILDRSLTIDEFLKSLRLSSELRESQLADRLIKEMIDIAADRYPRFIKQALGNLKIKKTNGSIEKRNKEIVRYAASKILKVAGYDCSKDKKEYIRDEFIEHLGDPRAGFYRANWSGVDEDSRKVFQQWLSQRDIEFFFEVVSETENQIAKETHWRYRKRFWEAYLPYIENTWVVMGNKAEQMAKLLFSKQDISKLNYGKLKGANSRQSVFFLRIQGYDIVEYSHQGASRIWKIEKSPLEFRANSISVNKFRRDDTTNIKRFIHRLSDRYRWQNEMKEWFRRNIGIEPTKSYRLNS